MAKACLSETLISSGSSWTRKPQAPRLSADWVHLCVFCILCALCIPVSGILAMAKACLSETLISQAEAGQESQGCKRAWQGSAAATGPVSESKVKSCASGGSGFRCWGHSAAARRDFASLYGFRPAASHHTTTGGQQQHPTIHCVLHHADSLARTFSTKPLSDLMLTIPCDWLYTHSSGDQLIVCNPHPLQSTCMATGEGREAISKAGWQATRGCGAQQPCSSGCSWPLPPNTGQGYSLC